MAAFTLEKVSPVKAVESNTWHIMCHQRGSVSTTLLMIQQGGRCVCYLTRLFKVFEMGVQTRMAKGTNYNMLPMVHKCCLWSINVAWRNRQKYFNNYVYVHALSALSHDTPPRGSWYSTTGLMILHHGAHDTPPRGSWYSTTGLMILHHGAHDTPPRGSWYSTTRLMILLHGAHDTPPRGSWYSTTGLMILHHGAHDTPPRGSWYSTTGLMILHHGAHDTPPRGSWYSTTGLMILHLCDDLEPNGVDHDTHYRSSVFTAVALYTVNWVNTRNSVINGEQSCVKSKG